MRERLQYSLKSFPTYTPAKMLHPGPTQMISRWPSPTPPCFRSTLHVCSACPTLMIILRHRVTSMICSLHAPPKWVIFKVAALNRASRLMRHLAHTPVRHLGPGKSTRDFLEAKDELHSEEFSVFEVEAILFKVHMSILRLEIYSPADPSFSEKENKMANPVVLSEKAENFRSFLWDLQAFPYELSHLRKSDIDVTHVIDRGLRIAEMAQKHNFTVLEARALESLRHFVLSPYFHSASSAQQCRALRVATQSAQGHDLLRDLSRRLIRQILHNKSSLDPALISLVEADAQLCKIRGAVYYRQLVDMERRLEGRAGMQPVFPTSIDIERRMRFLEAHNALSALSAQLSAHAPPVPSDGCPSHSLCLLSWEKIWARAAVESHAPSLGSADVLGRLRALMLLLKRMVSETPTVSIDCGLAALEAVVTLRDGIIDGLLDHSV
ncbi:hypothetical protein B0H11DRAFT_2051043 [Mycena galericulata]|nr:hypothetical protein B0H11DRAFT_2051043 [Mycena galericulata]